MTEGFKCLRRRPLICIAYERVGDALRGVPETLRLNICFKPLSHRLKDLRRRQLPFQGSQKHPSRKIVQPDGERKIIAPERKFP